MISTYCISKHTGNPLAILVSEQEAKTQARFLQLTERIRLIPYHCDRCNYWHLCPEDRYTPSITCHHCLDHVGKPKKLYLSYQFAKNRALVIFRERRQQLFIYHCPHQNGFHLTKSE